MTFCVSNTSWSGFGRFSISVHLWFWARIAFWWETSSRSAVRLLNLDTHMFLSAISASSISRSGWLTPVNAAMFNRDGSTYNVFFFFFPLWNHRIFSQRQFVYWWLHWVYIVVIHQIVCFFEQTLSAYTQIPKPPPAFAGLCCLFPEVLVFSVLRCAVISTMKCSFSNQSGCSNLGYFPGNFSHVPDMQQTASRPLPWTATRLCYAAGYPNIHFQLLAIMNRTVIGLTLLPVFCSLSEWQGSSPLCIPEEMFERTVLLFFPSDFWSKVTHPFCPPVILCDLSVATDSMWVMFICLALSFTSQPNRCPRPCLTFQRYQLNNFSLWPIRVHISAEQRYLLNIIWCNIGDWVCWSLINVPNVGCHLYGSSLTVFAERGISLIFLTVSRLFLKSENRRSDIVMNYSLI